MTIIIYGTKTFTWHSKRPCLTNRILFFTFILFIFLINDVHQSCVTFYVIQFTFIEFCVLPCWWWFVFVCMTLCASYVRLLFFMEGPPSVNSSCGFLFYHLLLQWLLVDFTVKSRFFFYVELLANTSASFNGVVLLFEISPGTSKQTSESKNNNRNNKLDIFVQLAFHMLLTRYSSI